MKLSFILPTCNEAGNIGKLIETINLQEELKKFKLEFIVIDDNSEDDTQNVVSKLINKRWPVKLIVRRQERGLATAILAGVKQAVGDYIIIMDTDLTHRPEDIYRLLEPAQKQAADLVVGSRYIPGGGMHVSEANYLQRWLSKWGNFVVNRIIFNFPVHESLSGFIVIKRDIIKTLDLDRIFYGYGEFCIRLIYYCYKKGYKIKEVPVMYGFRQYGVSKSSLKRMTYYYLKTVLELLFTKL